MHVPAKPRRAALLCCHVTRNLAYYCAGWTVDEPAFPRETLWRTLNSNFLDIAVIEWCKIFAETKAIHNWRHVVLDPNAFLPQMYSDYGATKDEWDLYVCSMRIYRDKFLAHLDRETTMHIPNMDLAQSAIFYIYDTMKAEQIDGVFRGLPRRLRRYSEDCKADAAKLYKNAAEQGFADGHGKVSLPLHSQGPRHLAVPLSLAVRQQPANSEGER